MTRSPRDRRAARDFGLRAETQALLFLLFKGYRLLARRYSAKGGEIDLIVMRGSTVAFVEVKARPDLEAAQTAITEEKRRRIARAASAWIARRRSVQGLSLRGDAVFIAPWRIPRHVIDAFSIEVDAR